MGILANENAISGGNYQIANSLRFQRASSQYLTRTPATNTNRKTWTWSGWVKRGDITYATATLFDGSDSGANRMRLFFENDNKLYLEQVTSSASSFLAGTAAVFRDPAAWYHIVCIFDSTQATSTDRVKIYINNTIQTLSGSFPSLNFDGFVNSTNTHTLGKLVSEYFDGYMTEINFIDGQALTPSSFGVTDATSGQWVAKKYAGTYGTNGFYLPFSNGTSTTTLGADSSGNGNNWTLTNFTRSAGVSDCWMYDVPSGNGGANGTQPSSNYAVMNRIGAVLPNLTNLPNFAAANLTLNGGTAVWRDSGVSTINMKSGKWYIETTVNTLTGGIYIGVTSVANGSIHRTYRSNATKDIDNVSSAYGTSYGTGSVVGLAIDCDGGTLTCYVNGVSQGALCTDLVSAMPADGWFYNAQIYSSSSVSVNFGNRSFVYAPPSGYQALCTANLPVATIKQGNKYMDATLYTGTNANLTITNAGAFAVDMLWLKSRSVVSGFTQYDSVRGANKVLISAGTNAEATSAAGTAVTAFNSNGFSLGTETAAYGSTNINAATYVAYQWKAGAGTTSSNTNGSITSTVSVNATAGFSIVTYTGNGTNGATVGHGLGVNPKLYIIKSRNSASGVWWVSGYPAFGAPFSANNNYLELDATNAIGTASTAGTTSSASTITFNNSGISVNSNGTTYVAYCFAEIAGFSKFGSYTGNGSTDGTFVYAGFRPKVVLIKRTDTTGSWAMLDTSRNPYNLTNIFLYPNLGNADDTQAVGIDIVSNGFKLRTSGAGENGSGGTFIYMAFAENPFAQANAR